MTNFVQFALICSILKYYANGADWVEDDYSTSVFPAPPLAHSPHNRFQLVSMTSINLKGSMMRSRYGVINKSVLTHSFALKLAKRRVLTAIFKTPLYHGIPKHQKEKLSNWCALPCPKSPNKPSGFCRYEGASGPNRIAINVMEKRLQLPLQEPIKSAEGQTFQKRSNRLFTIESSAISGSLIALQNHQREIPKEKLVLRFSQSFPFWSR